MGNVVSLVEKTAGLTDSTLSYSYDELNRLTGATRTGQDAFTHSYSLEGLGSDTDTSQAAERAQTLHYGTDRQGSVTMLTTDAGAVASELVYDPYGEEVAHTGTDWYNPFRYTGTYFDTSTGLYQMGARYYAPTTGRFSQQDPLPRSVYEANRYAYVGRNPVNNVDPTGKGLFGDCASNAIILRSSMEVCD